MDAMLRALADGTRRRILALVWREERTAGEIAGKFTMTRPAVSQHLAILRESELLSMRRDGTRRLYRANRQAVARLRAELGAFWDDHLAQLKDAAEAAGRRERRRGAAHRTPSSARFSSRRRPRSCSVFSSIRR